MDNMLIEVELKEYTQFEEILIIPDKITHIGTTYYTGESIKAKLKRRNIVKFSLTANAPIIITDFETGEIEIAPHTELNNYHHTLEHCDSVRVRVTYRFRNYKGDCK